MKTFLEQYTSSLPPILYRHFEQEEYALDFMNGNIRLGFYKSYSYLNKYDIRQNSNEGIHSLSIAYPDRTAHSTVGGTWPLYILCMHHNSVDRSQRNAHGKYSVKIQNPYELHRRLQKHLGTHLQASFLGNMVYNCNNLESATENIPILEISNYTDSPINSWKKEVRFSYYIEASTLDKKHSKNAMPFELSSELVKLNKYIHLPKYITIKNADIKDLCEMEAPLD